MTERKELNGWLFLWAKRLWCGMIYGHDYKRVTPEIQGQWGCECKKCGKFKVF